jgi:hypothetical protein
MTAVTLLAAVLLATRPAGRAQEVQEHGLMFEQWARAMFFDGCLPPGCTQKWDIPAAANRTPGGLPVNPKAAKYRTPVDLGDALRQFDINEPFIFVIGYWRQEGGMKCFVNIVAPPTVTPEQWRRLWGPVTHADREKLDALIKDRSLDYREVRQRAQAMKKSPPFNQAVIVLNPKIDSKHQRRLQCSLRFDDIFKCLASESDFGEQAAPELWGVPCPTTVTSGPRQFHRPAVQPVPAGTAP